MSCDFFHYCMCFLRYPNYHTILNPKNWQTYLLFYTPSISGILGLSNAIFAREGARDPLSRKGAIYPVDLIMADTVARIFICS